MKIPFARLLLYNARFFKQIIRYNSSDWVAFMIELNVHVFAKSTAVVIAIRFGIAKRFQNGIALDKYVFDSVHTHTQISHYIPTVPINNFQSFLPFDFILSTCIRDRCYVFHNNFRCFGFTST